MSNRIDQLFREKLIDHKAMPSAEAWTKVQSGLSKKNKFIIVWRMAAVFVLFGAITGSWYFLNHDETVAPIQVTDKRNNVTPSKEEIEKPKESFREVVKPNLAQTVPTVDTPKSTSKREAEKETQNLVSENIVVNNNGMQKATEDTPILTEPVLVVQDVKKEKPIVIEFILEPIEKESAIAVAQSNQEDGSGLKKILEAALDVKNGESDLGIIRDAKNQLFALDFRKDKSKRN